MDSEAFDSFSRTCVHVKHLQLIRCGFPVESCFREGAFPRLVVANFAGSSLEFDLNIGPFLNSSVYRYS